ncbi:hypothetical protein SUGI_0805470 [Cryptomeria japonica]|nr:hypothetical protein SUGI_0805470 [Cryptomeria japonica]
MVVDLRAEMEEDNEFWEKQAVIARIIGLNWPRTIIKQWVYEKWGDHIVIKFIPKGFFMVLFENQSKRDCILNQENWFVEEYAVYIQPWTSNFNPIPLLVYPRLIWVYLYNLPIEYWSEAYLEKIGRSLRTVLEIDFDEENDLCKSVRIRLVVVKRIPEHIALHSTNGWWRQKLEIERESFNCSRCGSKMHGVWECRLYVRRARNSFKN